ncbi:MAG: ImuA family protein [Rhizobium ruizarguesonis]
MSAARELAIAELRERISALEGGVAKRRECLPFGVPDIDKVLPGGGLAFGALHEFAGGGSGTVDGAAPALFVAGVAARTKGKVVWCLTRPDLFAPSLAQAGLHPDRIVFVESDADEDVLANMEEALSYGKLGAVVGEVVRLPMTASRRLQLAAEKSGTIGLVVRRWRRQTEANDFGNPTAAVTRWRVSVMPSEEMPVPGVGRARWLLELMRSRAGECAEFCVGACNDTGRIDLSSRSGDRQDTSGRSRHSG